MKKIIFPSICLVALLTMSFSKSEFKEEIYNAKIAKTTSLKVSENEIHGAKVSIMYALTFDSSDSYAGFVINDDDQSNVKNNTILKLDKVLKKY